MLCNPLRECGRTSEYTFPSGVTPPITDRWSRRLPLVHDWRLAPRAVGLDHPRQEVEARFVHENEGPVFAAGLLLQNWPRFDPPPLDGFFVPLDRPGDRDLRSPPQVPLSRRDTWLLLYETPNSW